MANQSGNSFMNPVQPDALLAVIVGSDPIARPHITKKLWAYIKEHGLQDTTNRRNINADDVLRPLFDGQDQVTMFQMTKLVAGHTSKIPTAAK